MMDDSIFRYASTKVITINSSIVLDYNVVLRSRAPD